MIFALFIAIISSAIINSIDKSKTKNSTKILFAILMLIFTFFIEPVALIFIPFILIFIKKVKIFDLNKYEVLAVLIILILVRGLLFDGFKEIQFTYNCHFGKHYDLEIFDNNYTAYMVNYFESENYRKCNMSPEYCPEQSGLFHINDIYADEKYVGKIYRYYMPYNKFHRRIVSFSYNDHGKICYEK